MVVKFGFYDEYQQCFSNKFCAGDFLLSDFLSPLLFVIYYKVLWPQKKLFNEQNIKHKKALIKPSVFFFIFANHISFKFIFLFTFDVQYTKSIGIVNLKKVFFLSGNLIFVKKFNF
jgi:hypothetical protein